MSIVIPFLVLLLLFLIESLSICYGYFLNYTDFLKEFDLFLQHPNCLSYLIVISSLAGITAVFNVIVYAIRMMEYFRKNEEEDKGSQITKEKLRNIYNKIEETKQERLSRLRSVKKFFDFNFTIIGGLIGLGIFTTGLMRLAIIEAICKDPEKCNIIPIDLLYAYGLAFTIILAVIYYPINYFYKNIGKDWIIDHLKDDDKKEVILKELKLNVSSTERLKEILKVSSPLLISFISKLLEYVQ